MNLSAFIFRLEKVSIAVLFEMMREYLFFEYLKRDEKGKTRKGSKRLILVYNWPLSSTPRVTFLHAVILLAFLKFKLMRLPAF